MSQRAIEANLACVPLLSEPEIPVCEELSLCFNFVYHSVHIDRILGAVSFGGWGSLVEIHSKEHNTLEGRRCGSCEYHEGAEGAAKALCCGKPRWGLDADLSFYQNKRYVPPMFKSLLWLTLIQSYSGHRLNVMFLSPCLRAITIPTFNGFSIDWCFLQWDTIRVLNDCQAL